VNPIDCPFLYLARAVLTLAGVLRGLNLARAGDTGKGLFFIFNPAKKLKEKIKQNKILEKKKQKKQHVRVKSPRRNVPRNLFQYVQPGYIEDGHNQQTCKESLRSNTPRENGHRLSPILWNGQCDPDQEN